jgi:uncharacterized RDD family membrane protein YckC
MLKKTVNILLDLLIIILLWYLAPVLIALMSPITPFYAKAIGIIFIALIIGAIVYVIIRNRRENPHRLHG